MPKTVKKRSARKQDEPTIEFQDDEGTPLAAGAVPIVATLVMHDLEDNAKMYFSFGIDGDMVINGDPIRIQAPQVALLISTMATAHGVIEKIQPKEVLH